MKIYDTMARDKLEFIHSLEEPVRMYVCGLTTYDSMHIGHAKSFVSFDFIVRYLEYRGFKVRLVINITDIDDKVIRRAAERGVEPLFLSSQYASEFLSELERLKIRKAERFPKASENIDEIISMIRKLMDNGFAYEIDGSIYFDITRTRNYGRLSGQSMEQILAGARVEVDERKRHPADFALWKAAKTGEIYWESPWGRGRPGWHIECSAMSIKYLGETIDIHGGGEDLIFPHHENEIQQSEAVTGALFSRYWMHVGLLNTEGVKMSKSLSNFITVRELLLEFPPEALRFFFANSLYRRQLNFSVEALMESETARLRLERYVTEIAASGVKGQAGGEPGNSLLNSFEEAMNDDFNTREAIARLFSQLREFSSLAGRGELPLSACDSILWALRRINSVLFVIREEAFRVESIDAEIEKLIAEREEARKRKDFAEADRIREVLRSRGIDIEDRAEGVRWRRVQS